MNPIAISTGSTVIYWSAVVIGDSKKTRKIINGVQEGRNVLKILEKMEILH